MDLSANFTDYAEQGDVSTGSGNDRVTACITILGLDPVATAPGTDSICGQI